MERAAQSVRRLGRSAAAPGVALKVPGLHGLHADCFASPPPPWPADEVVDPYFPAVHLVHASKDVALGVSLQRPSGQSLHPLALAMPRLRLNFPTGQEVQLVFA